jgi:hypothetical protein
MSQAGRLALSRLAKQPEGLLHTGALTTPLCRVFVRTQDFRDQGLEVQFSRNTNFPNEIIAAVRPHFAELLAFLVPERDEVFFLRYRWSSSFA